MMATTWFEDLSTATPALYVVQGLLRGNNPPPGPKLDPMTDSPKSKFKKQVCDHFWSSEILFIPKKKSSKFEKTQCL
jgi:hypothetical protein